MLCLLDFIDFISFISVVYMCSVFFESGPVLRYALRELAPRARGFGELSAVTRAVPARAIPGTPSVFAVHPRPGTPSRRPPPPATRAPRRRLRPLPPPPPLAPGLVVAPSSRVRSRCRLRSRGAPIASMLATQVCSGCAVAQRNATEPKRYHYRRRPARQRRRHLRARPPSQPVGP